MTTALESTGLQHPGKSALISGWGSTSEKGQSSDILQKAIVTIFDNSDPNLSYKEGVLTNAMIVAGYLDGFIDGCQGDSGGPMVVRDLTSSVGYRLAGVTSFGEGCARARYPGVYAKVSNFEDWISDTINKSLPTMEVGNAVVREGDAITRKADFLVSLSYKSLNTVSVAYQTVNGSATAGSDYEETHGTLTFGPGQVAKVISIPIISDTTKEDYENFFVKLTSPAGAILFDSKGTGEIIDGD
jgi:secreted trypsin-like serine protease